MNASGNSHLQLNVTLLRDPGDGDRPNLLVVNNGDHHHRFDKRENGHHTVTWTLTGNASDGEFCALDHEASPGFLWILRTPPENVFQRLARVGGNTLTLENHHSGKHSEGEWCYQLFARFGNRIHGIPWTTACGAANRLNPSIKNT